MISLRFAGVVLAFTLLVVGCAAPNLPGASPEPTARPTQATAATTSPTPSPVPTAAPPMTLGLLGAGTYVMTPFGPDGMGVCTAADADCTEDPADDSIRLTVTFPAGYEAVHPHMVFTPDRDTGLTISRGAGLYSRPCYSAPPPDIEVGPAVDDFAGAIADHPELDATTPVDVTLAGYSGKYIDLQMPAKFGHCIGGQFWPWEPGTYAHGSSERWHLWILDVDGIRVVIQSSDYERVSAERRAELQAIVDSITIEK